MAINVCPVSRCPVTSLSGEDCVAQRSIATHTPAQPNGRGSLGQTGAPPACFPPPAVAAPLGLPPGPCLPRQRSPLAASPRWVPPRRTPTAPPAPTATPPRPAGPPTDRATPL